MNAPHVVRSLDDIAGSHGVFSIIAMDQRNTLRRMFTAVGREGTDDQLRAAKVDVARELTPLASGLLVAGEPDLVGECVDVVREIIADCREQGVPCVIELVYPMPDRPLEGIERENAVIESARVLNDLDIDLLKLEYPGSPEACRRLASVLTRPWAVLSAGVPFDQFRDVMRIAFDEGGAAGFIAGRSMWREAVALDGKQRQEFLTTVARPRLETLTALADRHARPWRDAA